MCPNGDLDMYLVLTKVKLYVRQPVILKISEYFITALERLDVSYATVSEIVVNKLPTASQKI